MAFFCAPRPIMNSAISKGNPTMTVKNINKRKNAPPPFIPVIYGNFQMATSPITAPADDKIKPNLDDHC